MLWLAISWFLFVSGFAWALWFVARQTWRWSRRRSHCELCAYSLSHRVSDTCPECGHDVASRSPLIHARHTLLHVVIVLQLLVAAHLFYRLEAIQMRGWIAALPTTFLIMRFSAEEPYPAKRWAVSPLRRELGYRMEDVDFIGDSSLRVDTDKIARWQERWLIAKAMHIDYGPQLRLRDWQIPAIRILNAAWERDLLVPAQRDRVSRMCFIDTDTRDQWPIGASITAIVEPRLLVLGDGWELTAHSITPGYADFSIQRRSIDSMILWSNPMALGTAIEPGPVEYELVLTRYHAATHNREQILQENRVITTVGRPDADGLAAIQIENTALEALRPMVGTNLYGDPNPVVSFDVSSASFREALGAGRFAIAVALYEDGGEIGRGAGIWVNPDQAHRIWLDHDAYWEYQMYGEGRWRVSIQLQPGVRLDQPTLNESHEWSIRIRGDGKIALQDFDATSYWAGQHEFKDIAVEGADR